MTVERYRMREDEAAEELVNVLAGMPTAVAEALVRGAQEDNPGPLVAVRSGIWSQTATSDSNDDGQPYRLIGIDDHCEWEGAIRGLHVSGYRRVQIRTDFLLDRWPEFERGKRPSPSQRVVRAELRELVERIVATTPIDLAPLTQREIWTLVKSIMPASSREDVLRYYRTACPNPSSKRGPRGPRNPHRMTLMQELRERVLAEQLRN